jgi:hypothetical protein
MGINTNGEPIISFLDITFGNTISAMKYDGTEWAFVGPRGFSGNASNFPVIDVSGDNPYVAYTDNTNDEKTSVRTYVLGNSSSINDIVDEHFVLYPNPANDIVYIQNANNMEKIILSNFAGQVLLEQNTIDKRIELNTSEFETGIYFVTIFSNNKVSTRKLFINNN